MTEQARVFSATAVLLGAVTARLLLQVAVMPPYAGLDEVFHVARLSFRLEQGRNPNHREPSVPIYLHRSMNAAPGFLPAFGTLAEKWPAKVPEILRTGTREQIPARERRVYYGANYEAQQPSPYYSVAALAARLLTDSTPLAELRLWRLTSVLLALVIVLATASIAFHFYGAVGFLAAAVLVSFPTWLTLVVRASNDALACALIAVSLAISVASPRSVAGWFLEAMAWAGALAIKLYSWPLLMVLPLLWRLQRARPGRVAVVAIAALIATAVTSWELNQRTSNPLGLFPFDPSGIPSISDRAVAVDYVEMLKIFIASAIWTSGQHWNALTPAGMALYFGPILAVAGWAMVRAANKTVLLVIAAIVVSFGGAQIASGVVTSLLDPGSSLPVFGKEGWYWYAFAPILIGLPLSMTFTAVKRRGAILVIVIWLLGWDVVIHEGALFRDYAGLTTPENRTPIFRWGPLEPAGAKMRERLEKLAVGPFTGAAQELRVAHLIATLALAVLCTTTKRGGRAAPVKGNDRDVSQT